MKKQLTVFITALTLFATAGTAAFADDDDDEITCTADVEWQGSIYTVTESDDSMREVKEELIEEACEQACSHIRGDDDPCEHSCESNAKILHMNCDGDRHAVRKTVVHHNPVRHVEVHHDGPKTERTVIIHRDPVNSEVRYEYHHN